MRRFFIFINAIFLLASTLKASSPPPTTVPEPVPDIVPIDIPEARWDFIELVVKSDPMEPYNERFLGDWYFKLQNVDDHGREAGPAYYGEVGPDGSGAVGIPKDMFSQPVVITASNDAFGARERKSFEIFVPAYCYDKAVWIIGPLEDAVWNYYKGANRLSAEAWNASQVDCAAWLANTQLLIQSDEINDELHAFSKEKRPFDARVLEEAFRQNQQFLVPTRSPLCMAERRHQGGNLSERSFSEIKQLPFSLEEDFEINEKGMVKNLCGQQFNTSLSVNNAEFTPSKNFSFKNNSDFFGTMHSEENTKKDLNVRLFNIRLGNGRDRDSDIYQSACAFTQVAEFTNTSTAPQDLETKAGVIFHDLFQENTRVYLSSDGDNIIGPSDSWAILYTGDEPCREKVIAVELLGHRDGDYRDVLHMQLRENKDLFIGLGADYELEETGIDGEAAYMAYTISYWDGSSEESFNKMLTQNSSCYEAADIWARQFFSTLDFPKLCPLQAAEMAVRSQCFSNSRANSRWQTQELGFWSMNNNHGVHANLIVNPGWLAAHTDFEVFIQRFDEAVFKGPRTAVRSDKYGQVITALPTLVEGDRILLRAQDKAYSDYDLVIPCVPEFAGFDGTTGIAYVPTVLGPPAPLPIHFPFLPPPPPPPAPTTSPFPWKPAH